MNRIYNPFSWGGMSFRVNYQISKKQHNKFCELVFWEELNALSIKQLLSYIIKYLKETNIILRFSSRMNKDILGRHTCGDKKDLIEFNNKELTLQKLPSVIIHEILHGIFPQIEADDLIVKLERKIMHKIKHKEINQILNLFFKNNMMEYNGTFSRRVGSLSSEREP